MQKSLRIVALVALIGLGVWVWYVFFPGPERAIRARINKLAQIVSFEPGDGIVVRGYHAETAAGYFTTNAEISVDARGWKSISLNGRDEILQAMMTAARLWKGLKVEFTGIVITLDPDKQSARVNLTGKGTIPGERDFDVQEFNFYFQKVDGEWLINRVETVQTLSARPLNERESLAAML